MIQRVVYVRCDVCGENPTVNMADDGANATEQRATLKRLFGWTRLEGFDLCPTCRASWEVLDKWAHPVV